MEEHEYTQDEYETTKLFVATLAEDELIKFIIGQSHAINGLTSNNRTFAKAYREILNKKN